MKGFDQIRWFTGVVENRDDPIKAGRVQVRMHGFNNQDKALLPTQDLIWAQVATSVASASKDGIGSTPSDLLVGSWVYGFFLDGRSSQIPVVTHSFLGMGATEPDVNKLARNEGVTDKTRHTGIPTESGATVVEHASTYAAAYPFNRVKQTESGHVVEFDDTPGAERIHEKHKTGTYREVHPTGDKTERVVGESDYHFDKRHIVHCKDNAILTVMKGASVLINSESGEHLRLRVGNNGSIFIKVDGGQVNIDVAGTTNLKTSTLNVDTPQANFTGNIHAEGDVVAGSISLQNHTHTEQGDLAPTSPPN